MNGSERQLLAPTVIDPTLLRDVEFVDMPVRQILNRCSNPRLSFRWTINPYRGCEFGCVY
jgi:DNA repair photolyase